MMYYLNYLLKISLPCYRHCLIDGLYNNNNNNIKHVKIVQQIYRHMAYVSNKRITRLCSDIEVDKSELNENGNEKYLDVRLKNRNPRNLEQLLMEPKPMGYEMDEQNRHYWNKVILEKRSKYLIGKIVHHSGRTIVSASTNEPSIAVFLGSKSTYTDVKAAKILGQVLAMRSLESGIHSVFYDYREQRKSGEKLSSFIDALKQNGLNLDEQPVIFSRAQPFMSIEKRKLRPRWISFEKMKSIASSLSYFAVIFIVTDRFDNEIIECFNDKFRIIGPLVITYCDNDICKCPHSALPKRTWPIFSQCMRGLEITTSNLSQKKRDLVKNRVQLMSGNYYENLCRQTNVVVSDSVLTRKARAAAENHITMVSFDWIESCWTKYQYEHRKADEESIVNQYRLPLFYGLNITSSGITERDRIKNILQSNGGKYHPSLILRPILPNSILLVQEKRGEKYLNAKRLNIPCLLPKWVDDSIKAGFVLPFENYNIENLIDENHSTTITTVPTKKSILTTNIVPFTVEKSNEKQTNLQSILKEIIESNQCNEQLFDGNSIYAIGFDKNLLIMIRNCAQKFGAFFYESLCDSVTDVIVGKDITESSFKQLLENQEYVHRLVTIDWFINCIRSCKLCSQTNYRIHSYSQLKKQTTSSSSSSNTLSSKNLNIFKETNLLKIDLNDILKLKFVDETYSPKRNHSILGNVSSDDDSPDFVWSLEKKSDTPRSSPESTKSNDDNNESKNSKKLRTSSLFDHEEMNNDDDDDYDKVTEIDTNEKQSCSSSIMNDQIKTMNFLAGFMFSAFDDDSKTKLIKLSQDILNIIIIDDKIFTNEVTHLILNQPKCSEKVFAAISAGAFILKPEYIYDSIQAKKLLPEQNYQWGIDSNDLQSNNSDNNNIQSEFNGNRLMKSAIEWKQQIDENNNKKIFEDWKILLLNPMIDDDTLLNSCENILRAGGANIFSINDLMIESCDTNLGEIIESIDYAIVNPNWTNKPKLSRGPKLANMETLRQRFSITNNEIRNCLSRFY
uniref:Uncharacterized protein LOC113796211 n=1 Tax=Dermatophagoides pteronyssinus TaxID=6956 RepID=A0A6P6YA27_DERPT|nr:uncharacterized protein LOC113796211 [Dermatophagoides pteronyssinus]